MTLTKAYELLASQPTSIAPYSAEKCENIVISAVTNDLGNTIVISRYGDTQWDMWPFFNQSNLSDGVKSFNWLRIPEGFRPACKAVIYRYWRTGIPGTRRPGAVSIMRVLQALLGFTKYLTDQNLTYFSQVRPIHVSNFVHNQRNVKCLSTNALVKNFFPLEILYRFNKEHEDGLKFHPWPESSYFDVAGMSGQAREKVTQASKTPLIPKGVAQQIFSFSERVLNNAHCVLDERDTGLRRKYRDQDVKLIRDCCFFLIGILTGMRCEEIVGIEIDAGRTEKKNGITYHWVTSIEHKTFKGRVEYMMPSLGHVILEVMERFSAPLRLILKNQICKMESETCDAESPRYQKTLARLKANQNRLFLGVSGRGVSAVTIGGWRMAMRNLASLAGTDWALAPHQMRRLYAWTFVRHRLGNLLFLKEQFKHSSLDMSQLYASNPNQDSPLYDEIFEEIQSQKVDIIESWLSDEQPLAGGAGIKIMKMRGHDFPNRSALILETSTKLNLRSTGHGWCLAQDDGCGGQGLYEKGLCVDCGNGVIDQSFKKVWQQLYSDQQELVREAEDLGPGAVDRVRRDMSRAKKVLNALGANIE
ncbi:phage integrase family protein [Massilia sp. TW-1]|uniref:Phage integrase family protein n=1 Tax=Telluria antibiotica TaxID=2717319 RepID=A0ABX0PFD2_9BURK|nr:phage integrase family protein [Telluria antibiotica]NIA54760.1 phage integrase family protein [Telluria antibiotica]